MTFADSRAVEAPALVDRIVVGSRDISWFRNKRTPTPSYQLIEPFAYGAATITVPQVVPFLEAEQFGESGTDLRWVRQGLPVLIQRVNPTTNTVVETVYRGRVMPIRASKHELVLECGGILTGPAETRNKQVPVVYTVKDIGRWMFDGIENSGNFPGVHFEPRLGPTTGIELMETGGMTHLGWLQHLCTMAVHKNGDQWTCMPTEDGGATFELRLKDPTTKHYSVWLDGDRVDYNLVDDPTEQWNTGYATGMAPADRMGRAMLWDGTVLPRVDPEPAPAFPGTLSVGSSGADVIVLHWKLINTRLMEREDGSPDFDEETKEAVERLQDKAELPATGIVNEATWNALFDVETTSWSLDGARIEPHVQKSATKKWKYGPNGNLISPNPNYKPHVLRVDRNIDFGAGVTERQAVNWMRGQIERMSGKSWAGTITLRGSAVFGGEWNEGSAPTSADIVSARSVLPGRNIWVPNFDGGTMFHIAEVNVSPGNTPDAVDEVTLNVDTHYRDALELSEIIARNKDSRRDARRDWVAEMRGSRRIHDGGTPFTQKCGINTRLIECPANTWTVFELFTGSSGVASEIQVVTDPPAEFATVWHGMKVRRGELMAAYGNPLAAVPDSGESWLNNEAKQAWYRRHLGVYANGTEEQPGGYWPRMHTGRTLEVTDAPLTGVWQDEAGFRYVTGEIPALWVAIYPDRDTVVQRGRMMWAQVDPA